MKPKTRGIPRPVLIGILVIVLVTAGCTSSPAPAQGPPVTANSAENTVLIKNFAFNPSSVTVKAGTTVTWINQDGTQHNVISGAESPVAFASRNLGTGESFTYTFSSPGTYPYICSIHPFMTGEITVIS